MDPYLVGAYQGRGGHPLVPRQRPPAALGRAGHKGVKKRCEGAAQASQGLPRTSHPYWARFSSLSAGACAGDGGQGRGVLGGRGGGPGVQVRVWLGRTEPFHAQDSVVPCTACTPYARAGRPAAGEPPTRPRYEALHYHPPPYGGPSPPGNSTPFPYPSPARAFPAPAAG
eukprot:scaffold11625_cov123-Isochrysis_galbana.AAC.4